MCIDPCMQGCAVLMLLQPGYCGTERMFLIEREGVWMMDSTLGCLVM